MSFDEYYASIFEKHHVSVRRTQESELQHSHYLGNSFEMSLQSIELFDGVRLDFGRYRGDFKEFLRKAPRVAVLHFGYCLSGEYEGLLEGEIPFCLGVSDIWSCSMYNTMHTTAPVQCQTIGFSIGISEAKNELGKFLRHCDISALHDHLLDNPLCCPANRAMIKIFGELSLQKNSDLLRLNALKLLLMFDTLVREAPRDWQKPQTKDYCKEIHHLINRASHRNLSLEHLAKMHNISVAKLTRDFARVYGISIYQYIKQVRLQNALKLLARGDKNVSQIANEVGYVNVSAFCKNFKQSFGKSPKSWLKQSQSHD